MKQIIPLTLTLYGLNTLFATGQFPEVDFRNPIHQYDTAVPIDPFSKFLDIIIKEEANLNYKSEKDYLLSLLNLFSISPHSQLLVFSTTSLQLNRISPSNPRAIYFSEDVYLGYVPGGQIEIIGIDPYLGAIPYIFNLPDKNAPTHPKIYRSKRCMNCHASNDIGGIPGLLISSVIPAPGGGTIDVFRKRNFGHSVSYNERFGGWHITGPHPFTNSWANSIGSMQEEQIKKIDNPPGAFFGWEKYLTNSSEIIPHLILEHQVGFTNLCISISYKFREISNPNKNLSNQKIKDFIESEAQSLLSYILFKDEPPFPQNQIDKNSKYINDFQKGNNSLKIVHSLRKLNLETRLFENRCSYMLFSNSFKGLPVQIKDHLIPKLHFILTSNSEEVPEEFSYLGVAEKERIHKTLSNLLQEYPSNKKGVK